MERYFEPWQKAERSIITSYRKRLWGPFIHAVKDYELIQEGDRIAVCISGGKDSMLLAKLMQELQRHSKYPFELKFLVMDPGYNAVNRQKIEDNARILNIPITIFESDIFDVANTAERNPCYLCARMRRGFLYEHAQSLGCNKIALGHHFNDVIETTVMGMFWSAQLQAMPPKLKAQNFPGMELIRPMYMIHEEDIIAWANYNQLSFIQCACRFTEASEAAGEEHLSKRKMIKMMLRDMRKENPDIEKNIFNSIHAVSIDTFPGWKAKGEEHSFLEDYYKTEE